MNNRFKQLKILNLNSRHNFGISPFLGITCHSKHKITHHEKAEILMQISGISRNSMITTSHCWHQKNWVISTLNGTKKMPHALAGCGTNILMMSLSLISSRLEA